MTDPVEHEETPTSVRVDLAEALAWSVRAGQAMHQVEVLMDVGEGDEDE